MTIEEKIDKYLLSIPGWPRGINSLEFETWYHKPLHKYTISCNADVIIDKMIESADEVECFTSKYKYIRECKKWYLKNKKKVI